MKVKTSKSRVKPTMTLRFGAGQNSLTITEPNGDTTFDFNKMRRDHSDQIKRMAVDAWCKVNGVRNTAPRSRSRKVFSSSPKKGAPNVTSHKTKKAVNGRRKTEVCENQHTQGHR